MPSSPPLSPSTTPPRKAVLAHEIAQVGIRLPTPLPLIAFASPHQEAVRFLLGCFLLPAWPLVCSSCRPCLLSSCSLQPQACQLVLLCLLVLLCPCKFFMDAQCSRCLVLDRVGLKIMLSEALGYRSPVQFTGLVAAQRPCLALSQRYPRRVPFAQPSCVRLAA